MLVGYLSVSHKLPKIKHDGRATELFTDLQSTQSIYIYIYNIYIYIRATPGVCPGVTLTIRASTIINYHGINYHHFRVKVLGFRF